MPDITRLFFDGAGIRGLTYPGALYVLAKAGIIKESQIQEVGGSSAGAITALYLATGHKIEDIPDIMHETDFGTFIESRWITTWARNLLLGLGIDPGRNALKHFRQILSRAPINNPDITFRELHELRLKQIQETGSSPIKDLTVVMTNLTKKRVEFFSYNSAYADIPIAEALCASIALPLVFHPRKINDDLYVDGGIIEGFCVHCMDREGTSPNEVLAFRIDSSDVQIPEVVDLLSLARNYTRLYMNYQNNIFRERYQQNYYRSVVSKAKGIDTINFDLDQEGKYVLFRSGMQGAFDYLKRNKQHNFRAMRRNSSLPDLKNAKPTSRLTRSGSFSHQERKRIPPSIQYPHNKSLLFRDKKTNHDSCTASLRKSAYSILACAIGLAAWYYNQQPPKSPRENSCKIFGA